MFFLAFGISFKVLLKVFSGLKKEKPKDTYLQDLKEKHFKLMKVFRWYTKTMNRPVIKKPRLHSFKNSARSSRQAKSRGTHYYERCGMDFPVDRTLNQNRTKLMPAMSKAMLKQSRNFQ